MKAQRGKGEAAEPPISQPALNPEVFGVSGGTIVSKDPTSEADTTRTPAQPTTKTLRPTGSIPSKMWNRLGKKIIPKLKSAGTLEIGLEFTVTVSSDAIPDLQNELKQIMDDFGIAGSIRIEIS